MKDLKKFNIAVAITIFLVFFSFAIACGNSSPEETKEYSMEYRLAVINEGGYVEEDDPVVKEFKILFDSINEKAIEGPMEIGDILVTAHEILTSKYKIKITLLELTRNLEELLPRDSTNINFEEFATVYITILIESQ